MSTNSTILYSVTSEDIFDKNSFDEGYTYFYKDENSYTVSCKNYESADSYILGAQTFGENVELVEIRLDGTESGLSDDELQEWWESACSKPLEDMLRSAHKMNIKTLGVTVS